MNTSDLHAHCIESLPALLASRLSPMEAKRVRAHADACSDCRAELELGRRVRAHFAREWREVAPLLEPARVDAGFENLWSRVSNTQSTPPKARSAARQWAVRVTALAAAVLLGIGADWYRGAAEPRFATYADSAPTCHFRAQAAPGVSDAEVRRALEAAGARILAGPDDARTYTVAVGEARALDRVRAAPEVTRADDAKGCS